MREILTLQIGGYANFVGSHFWNFQDEILGLREAGFEDPMIPTHGLNMDVLYRQGETRERQATYTPRLLSIDLRGSSGAVNPSGSLYERPPPAVVSSIHTWQGPAATFKAERHERNKFLQSLDDEEAQYREQPGDAKAEEIVDVEVNERQRYIYQSLEEEVQFSTDYLKAHLHPSSTYQIPGCWQGVTPFEDYGTGQGLFSSSARSEEIRDRVRLFVEECDTIQGFQCFVDDSGGFSAVAADLLEDVGEEYGRTPIFLFTVRPPRKVYDTLASKKKKITHALHDSVSLARLSSIAHLTVPLGLSQVAACSVAEHLAILDEKDYHTSALYAAAINCITLPFRMEAVGPSDGSQSSGLGGTDMGTALPLVSCSDSRRVAMMQASFPSPALLESKGEIFYNLHNTSSLTPSTERPKLGDRVAKLLVLQGTQLPGTTGERATVGQVHKSVVKAHEITAKTGRFSSRLATSSHLAISECPLAVPLPFPFIFGNKIGRFGNILSRTVGGGKQGRGGLDVSSVPVGASVSSSEAVLPYIKRRALDLQRFALSRSTTGPSLLQDWGFDGEESKDLRERLTNMVAAYSEMVESSSSDTD
ncbi:hypothetical protein R1flu_004841 [Riccia fluitans]|uniref:Uncharacterized protein n=1 Tax=Riccia fluitans TaxID=41844 RepID=A0ABD1YRF5_9MARC